MQITPFDHKLHFATLLNWFQDPQIMKGMGMDLMTEEQLKEWILDDKIILMAVEGDNVVGMLNFYHHKTQRPQIEVGYLISPEHQGRGLATELLGKGVEYLRTHNPDITEITETYVEDFNDASKRVLEKNGFQMYAHRPEKQRTYYRLEL